MAETVAEILAARGKEPRKKRTDLQRGLDRLHKIDRLLKRLVRAARPDHDSDDWKLIYEALFTRDPEGIRPRTLAALELAGFDFPDYYDPDTSYDDDVLSWIRAFEGVLAKVEERAALTCLD